MLELINTDNQMYSRQNGNPFLPRHIAIKLWTPKDLGNKDWPGDVSLGGVGIRAQLYDFKGMRGHSSGLKQLVTGNTQSTCKVKMFPQM